MAGATLNMLLDENSTEKFNQVQVKKLTVPQNEAATKRAALGDLQNRGISRNVTTKDAAQKELKDGKPPNVLSNPLRNAKARVDTNWKKQPLGVNQASNANQMPAATKTTVSVRLRSQASRTNAISVQSTGLQRQGSANALVPTLTKANTKVVDKLVTKPKGAADAIASSSSAAPAVATLRREDSDLSRKSLTKLRAAMAKPAITARVASTETAAVTKKLPVSSTLNKLGKLRPASAPATLSLSTKRLVGIENIDADDADKLVLVAEYVNDIYDYLYQVETEQFIASDHLAGQLEVSSKMRGVLMDWINEVHMQFHLAAETYQLAVAIIDRYLQVVKNTKRSMLQLVGVTALFLAAKYEELFPPAIGDFVYITDDTYTSRQIRLMELQVFKAIDCNLSRPLPIHFLRRFSKAAGAEDAHHAMSKYFLELASIEYELASYKPSEIAAASLFLSLNLLNGNAKAGTGLNDKHWTPTLAYYSRYTAAHLRPITKQIAKLAKDAPQARLRTVYKKYQENKFQKIATRPELYGALMDSIVGKNKK